MVQGRHPGILQGHAVTHCSQCAHQCLAVCCGIASAKEIRQHGRPNEHHSEAFCGRLVDSTVASVPVFLSFFWALVREHFWFQSDHFCMSFGVSEDSVTGGERSSRTTLSRACRVYKVPRKQLLVSFAPFIPHPTPCRLRFAFLDVAVQASWCSRFVSRNDSDGSKRHGKFSRVEASH